MADINFFAYIIFFGGINFFAGISDISDASCHGNIKKEVLDEVCGHGHRGEEFVAAKVVQVDQRQPVSVLEEGQGVTQPLEAEVEGVPRGGLKQGQGLRRTRIEEQGGEAVGGKQEGVC